MRPNNGVVEVPESPLPALLEEIAAQEDLRAFLHHNWNRILRVINDSTVAARDSAAAAIDNYYRGADEPTNTNRPLWMMVHSALREGTRPADAST